MSALKLNTKRKYTFKQKTDETAYSITFEFQSAEDIDYSDLDKYTKADGSINEAGSRKATLRSIRQAIISWTNITDMDEKPLEINDENTRAVMDAILTDPVMFKKILTAYQGLSSKN